MRTLEDLVNEYVIFVRDDHADLGLWVIADDVRQEMGLESDAAAKDKTLVVVQKLMERNIMPGSLANGRIEFWQDDPSQLLLRIAAMFPEQGNFENGSCDCWFYFRQYS